MKASHLNDINKVSFKGMKLMGFRGLILASVYPKLGVFLRKESLAEVVRIKKGDGLARM